MPGPLMTGLAAGAVGTATLNIITYTDMLLRGRGGSSVPSDVAGEITDAIDVALRRDDEDEQAASNRQSALGSLFGYVTGLGVGAAYGLARPHMTRVPRPVAGLLLGAAAMAGSDVPATALGVTDPRSWGGSSWVSDIVPHLAYGMVVAAAYDAFARDSD